MTHGSAHARPEASRPTPTRRGSRATRPLAIHLDRLETELGKLGIQVRRHEVMRIAAAAFGLGSTNALTTLAEKGELTPPAARFEGSVEHDGCELIVAYDPVADATFAIPAQRLDAATGTRGGGFALSPYGTYLDMGGLAGDRRTTGACAPENATVHAVVLTEDGEAPAIFAGRTGESTMARAAAHCSTRWNDYARLDDVTMPLDHGELLAEFVSVTGGAWHLDELDLMASAARAGEIVEDLDDVTCNTIVVALRHWQGTQGERIPHELRNLAAEGGGTLGDAEIDDLCESFNLDRVTVSRVADDADDNAGRTAA